MFKDPFDPKALLGRGGCSCGGNHAQADHARLTAAAVPAGEEERWNRVVDAAVLRAVFPVDAQRRQFLKTVGAATAMAAISSVLPLGAAREAFAQGGPGVARRRRRTSRSASSPSPAPRRSSWPIRWASIPSRGSTSKS